LNSEYQSRDRGSGGQPAPAEKIAKHLFVSEKMVPEEASNCRYNHLIC